MRETFARVLAAALIIGVFAAVAGTSALFGTPGEPTERLAAPPAALERTVRITVAPAPVRRHHDVARHRATLRPQTIGRQVRHVVAIHTKEKPRPKRPTAPRALASSPAPDPPAPQPVAPEASAQTDEESGDDDGHHGHAYGHDKEHHEGHGHQEHAE